MNIIEQVKALEKIHAAIYTQDETDSLDLGELLALAESHERLLKAAKGIAEYCGEFTSDEAADAFDEAIEQAEKLAI